MFPNPKKLEEEAKKIQKELLKTRVVAESGGGVVRATFSCKPELLSLEIDQAFFKEHPDELELLIISAINDGIRKAFDIISENVMGKFLTAGEI